MTIERSATHIFCQRCGSSFALTDTEDMIKFQSTSTVGVRDYSSPALIAALSPLERITHCPKCHERSLDRALADGKGVPLTHPSGNPTDYLEVNDASVNPDLLDNENPGKGDATVTHKPID